MFAFLNQEKRWGLMPRVVLLLVVNLIFATSSGLVWAIKSRTFPFDSDLRMESGARWWRSDGMMKRCDIFRRPWRWIPIRSGRNSLL